MATLNAEVTSAQLAVALSDNSSALLDLAQRPELSEEDRSEMERLRTERADLDRRAAAANAVRAAELVTPVESADRAELRAAASLGEIMTAAVEHRSTTGATAELQSELGVMPNTVPLELIEDRAVTPAPTSGEPVTTQPVIGQLFTRSVSAFLGVTMPTVAAGESSYPVLTSTTTASRPAADAAVTETTGAFASNILTPSRIQASFFWRREDAARYPQLEPALRDNLSMALSDAVDDLTLTTVLGSAPAGVDDVINYVIAIGLLDDLVDGYHASTIGEIRAVVNPAVYGKLLAILRSNNDATSALEFINRLTGGVRVSAHMPAASTRNSETNNADILFRVGLMMDAVTPIWEGVTLIPDEITLAANGQIKLTAVMLAASAVLRSSGFVRKGVKLS